MFIPLLNNLFSPVHVPTHRRKAVVRTLRQINHDLHATVKRYLKDTMELSDLFLQGKNRHWKEKREQVQQERQTMSHLLKQREKLRAWLSAR